tara:strand:- start:22 stop:453 length:432 start_codon:yes stop_codon:yes gene_type:complete
MATEILINDGGAPARIMNLGAAGAAISAGTFVDIDSNGKIQASTADQEASSSGQVSHLGVLLVDAVSGGATSVITGKGIVCNVLGAEAISTVGTQVTVDDAGKVEPTDNADTNRVVGITLAASFSGTAADGSAVANMVKVLLI